MQRKTTILLIFLVLLMLSSCGTRTDPPDVTTHTPSIKVTEAKSEDLLTTPEIAPSTTQETTAYGPPINEYTDIVLHDDRYYLCRLVQSGFSENGEYYGIYDALNCRWALDYAQYDTHDIDMITFQYHGSGVFSYQYSWYYGTKMFLSADLGYSFETEKIYNYKTLRFIDGKAIALIHDEPSQTYINGMIAPDSKLVWIDTYGAISDVVIPGFDPDDLIYWSESVLTGDSDQNRIYANSFCNYNTGSRLYYVLVYHYKDGTVTLISDQEYTTRLQEYIGDSPSNSNITIKGDLIRIDQLEGDDGNLYYAEFDFDGNLVTPASPME